MGTFRGQQINEVDVRDLIEQGRQEQQDRDARHEEQGTQQGTPGRWELTPHGNIMDDTGVIALVEGRHGRLICAAVNACREALPALCEEAQIMALEGGGLKKTLDRYAAQQDAARALLAECREALAGIAALGVGEIQREGRLSEVLKMVQRDARATLARLEA